ncbi:MAG: RuvX/YqgF family protein [Minisyncoccia bacterium]|jgi:putative Holliday junction resolvase
MRSIGIDYGSRRVGVAVSDESGRFALPVAVLVNSPELAAEIRKIAAEGETKEVVLGESRKYDMSPNPVLPDIMAFKSRLESAGLSVHLEPEFMTTAQAERTQGRHDKTDASAAALILQSFLDRRHGGEKP